jgi:DNA-directed RNA polymerase specialized sigma24 family protein
MDGQIYARCLAHARRVLPPDPAIEAEDLVQAAYAKVGNRLDTTRPAWEQGAYLCRAITQLAIDRQRACRRHPRAQLADWCPSPRDPEAEALAQLDLAALLAAVPPALVLYACGYLWTEVGAMLGVSAQSAKVRAWRWRRAQTEA